MTLSIWDESSLIFQNVELESKMYEGYMTIVTLVIQDLNGKNAKNIASTQSEDRCSMFPRCSIFLFRNHDSYSFNNRIIHLCRLHVAIIDGSTHFQLIAVFATSVKLSCQALSRSLISSNINEID